MLKHFEMRTRVVVEHLHSILIHWVQSSPAQREKIKARWCTHFILALQRLRQEYPGFKSNVGYLVRPCLKNIKF
jgi:hypothetical protein